MVYKSSTRSEVIPGSLGDPSIVCVFPAPVAPYANTASSKWKYNHTDDSRKEKHTTAVEPVHQAGDEGLNGIRINFQGCYFGAKNTVEVEAFGDFLAAALTAFSVQHYAIFADDFQNISKEDNAGVINRQRFQRQNT